MKYKLIGIDLDGTLLNNRKLISPKDLNILKRVYEKGIHIAILTGRNEYSAKLYADYIGVKSSIIANNGSIIKTENGSSTIIIDIEWYKILEVIKCAEILNLHYNLVTTEQIYYHRKPLKHEIFYGDNDIANHSDVMKYSIIESLEDIKDLDEKVLKLHILDDNTWRINKFLDKMPYKTDFDMTKTPENQLEICHKDASKGSALKIIADYYDISSDGIIAIGDSGNDLSMIEFASIGIAMENGMDIIKKKANYITKSNEENGVYYGIKKFINL